MSKTVHRPGADSGRPTEDEVLLESPRERPDALKHSDPWRVLRITGEFVEGFDALADVTGAVTIFGSARTAPTDPMHQQAVKLARRLAAMGFPQRRVAEITGVARDTIRKYSQDLGGNDGP